MIADTLKGLEEFEAELWKIADNLRANSNLASNEYFMPMMGLLFLREARRINWRKTSLTGSAGDRILIKPRYTRQLRTVQDE